jgi:hypothetical protein
MDAPARLPSLRRTAVILTVLFLGDLGFAGQGLLALAVAGVGFALLAIGAVWSAVRGGVAPQARNRAGRAAMYVVLGIATIVTMQFHTATAMRRALQVISASRAYQVKHGRLPDRLDELVPEFLPAVPRAKYTVQWGAFTYVKASEQSHTLMFTTLPPFGRQLYHFEAAEWSQRD